MRVHVPCHLMLEVPDGTNRDALEQATSYALEEYMEDLGGSIAVVLNDLSSSTGWLDIEVEIVDAFGGTPEIYVEWPEEEEEDDEINNGSNDEPLTAPKDEGP